MAERFGVSFAKQFGLDSEWFKENQVLNPTLDVDTPLFIDPFLLKRSTHPEFAVCAYRKYEKFFGQIYKLLISSSGEDDVPYRSAKRRLLFREIQGTCLGYSRRSVRGSGFGAILAGQTLDTAKSIIDLGVEDVEFFSMLSLFEEGIGPDRISDMVTNIILDCLLKFNSRILAELEEHNGKKIPREDFNIGDRLEPLPRNPFDNRGAPVILVASDVLKNLPIVSDIRQIPEIAQKNSKLRDRVNEHVQSIWSIRLKKDKERIKKEVLTSAAAFQTFLDLVKILESKPYDLIKDKQGLLLWRSESQNAAVLYPREIEKHKGKIDNSYVLYVCEQIIDQFRYLVEDCRLNRLFWVDNDNRPERFAQLLFLGIAKIYCTANNLDVSPESDAGAGPVDFKISNGKSKALVEIKLSSNSKVVHGYEKQLEAYLDAEDTRDGYYVVVDVGRIGQKWLKLEAIAKQNPEFAKHRRIYRVDGRLRESGSRR